MAITTFIPQIWSARLLEKLNRKLVFGSLVNRNYEGEILQYGDTVHINSLEDITVKAYTPNSDIDAPEQLTTTDTALVIDHGAYYNFYVDDVDKVQARADLIDAAMENASRRLAEDTEAYILTKIIEGAGTKTSGAIPTGGIYEMFVMLKMALDEKNVPRAGRKLVVPSAVEAELLLDSRFITGTESGNERLENGMVARAAGFEIYLSNLLTDKIVALNMEGVTFAQQLTEIEAYRPEKKFADGVKGLSLCGAKVVQPDVVLVHELTA